MIKVMFEGSIKRPGSWRLVAFCCSGNALVSVKGVRRTGVRHHHLTPGYATRASTILIELLQSYPYV